MRKGPLNTPLVSSAYLLASYDGIIVFKTFFCRPVNLFSVSLAVIVCNFIL